MRYSRQNMVLEIIRNNEVDTQEMLCQLLKDAGYEVTQATVSRDIKELQLSRARQRLPPREPCIARSRLSASMVCARTLWTNK